MRNLNNARARRLGTWEAASAWLATHPDVATLSAVFAAVGIPVAVFAWTRSEGRVRRLQELVAVASTQRSKSEQDVRDLTATQQKAAEREKELRSSLTAAETTADTSAKRAHEATNTINAVRAELQSALGRESRLKSSISHRGQLGERALEHLLDDLKRSGSASEFTLQPNFSGRRPDALAQLAGARSIVVDSKFPEPPHELLGATDEAVRQKLRQKYVETLKKTIRDLGDKRYHAAADAVAAGSFARTWLLLPGEGYLQAAYDADGADSLQLHAYAEEKGVALVGPHGLRSALQMWRTVADESAATLRVEEDGVQRHLQQLQPKWTNEVLPKSKALGKDLKKVVADFNAVAALVIDVDNALRHKEVFDLPKVKKTALPPIVSAPDVADPKSE